jgi:signal transduction histidine kinase
MATSASASQDKSPLLSAARAAATEQRVRRLLSAILFGALIAIVSFILDIYLTRGGISLPDTSLNNLLVGFLAGLLAYTWTTAAAEKHQGELTIEKLKHEAVLRERNRIAQDIHDTVSQGLAGIVYQLEAAEDFSAESPGGTKHLERARELARDTLKELRQAVWNLRADALQRESFAGAIVFLAKRLTEGTPVRVDFSIRGFPRHLPPEIEEGLLRIVQEAFANIIKHSKASKARIEMALSDGQIQLCVEDDGCGFAPRDSSVRNGFGLTSMRERAQALGGLWWVYSQPRHGTQVQSIMPLDPAVNGGTHP